MGEVYVENEEKKNLTHLMNAKIYTYIQTVVETTQQKLVKMAKGNQNCKIYKKHPFPGSMEDGGSCKQKKNICLNSILYNKHAIKI